MILIYKTHRSNKNAPINPTSDFNDGGLMQLSKSRINLIFYHQAWDAEHNYSMPI